MEYYLEEGCFPNNDGAPARSNNSRREEESSDRNRPTGRRTPSRRGDAF